MNDASARTPVTPSTRPGCGSAQEPLVVGLLSQVPLGTLHPHQEYANDSAAAFHEYAHSEDWVLVHLGQYVGVLLVAIGLVAVATSPRGAGPPASSEWSPRSPP